MRHLPIFMDVQGRTAVLAGRGPHARRKLDILRRAGANVQWFTGDAALGKEDTEAGDVIGNNGRIIVTNGLPSVEDLAGGLLAIVAFGDDTDALVAARARAAGVPVNAVDRPDLSTFVMPAIVDRGDVVVAMGTGGAAPVVARRVRERIEAVLPERIGELAGLIGRFRERAAAVRRVSGPMRRFWERVVDGPIGAAALAGRMAEAEAALERAFQDAANTSEREIGSVHIVATGAGDPDLLTLRALQALQNADVVLHDDAPDAILDRARRDADRYRVPLRHSGTTAADAIIAYARRGLSVVLLVPEDAAATFGDADFAALENAGLRAILVPGVSGPAATPRPTTESSV